MKRLSFVVVGIGISFFACAQTPIIIQAPATIGQVEYQRLNALPDQSVLKESEAHETPKGDVVVRIKGLGYFIVSKGQVLGKVGIIITMVPMSCRLSEKFSGNSMT